MTVIIEVYDTQLQTAIYLSDCAVSLLGENDLISANFLPLHWESGSPFMTVARRRLAKSKLSEGQIILFSGMLHRIEKAASEYAMAPYSNLQDFQNFLDSLYADEDGLDGYLYTGKTSEGWLTADTNCETLPLGKFEIRVCGSGRGVVKKIVEALDEPPEHILVGDVAFKLLNFLISAEFSKDGFGVLGFGGGYELFFRNEDGYRRCDYFVLDLDVDISTDDRTSINLIRTTRAIYCYGQTEGTIFFCEKFKNGEVGMVESEAVLPVLEFDMIFDEDNFLKDGFEPVLGVIVLRHQGRVSVGSLAGKDLVEIVPLGGGTPKINQEALETYIYRNSDGFVNSFA